MTRSTRPDQGQQLIYPQSKHKFNVCSNNIIRTSFRVGEFVNELVNDVT